MPVNLEEVHRLSAAQKQVHLVEELMVPQSELAEGHDSLSSQSQSAMSAAF